MSKADAIAIVKAINRRIRRRWYGGITGWDFATFSVVHPRTCAVFNEAATVITGKKGRFLPRA